MQFTAAIANKVTLDMVAKATGSAITTGTVTAYLIADSGDNTGKWWNAGAGTWSATEVSAGIMTFKGGSSWQVSIAAGAWEADVKYTAYGTESGSLNIPYSEIVSDKTGFSLSTAGVKAIWDQLTSALTTVGSMGKKLADWVVGTIDTYTGNTKQTADVADVISAGVGPVTWTYTATDNNGDPVADTTVYASTTTTLEDATHKATTNSFGIATFYLTAGNWYFWPIKAGTDFGTLPDLEAVS